MTQLPPICLTGPSGFVGRYLVQRLAAIGADDVTLLARDPSRLAPHASRPAWRVVQLDLERDAIPGESIPAGAVVLHLAGATGQADARRMHAMNVDATAKLLHAASRAGHFLFVSSVAAGYSDQRWAPYATSKLAAEQLVATAGLPYTIVRPTMIFGPGSPNQQALERLATLALPVMPGQGHVRVQPIHVADVVAALLYLAMERPARMVITVGGPALLTMRDLYAAIRRARGLAPREPMMLPLEPLRRLLALGGMLTGSRLPVSAGQFAAFANDSAATSEHSASLPMPRVSLPAMLAGRTADA